MTLVSPNTKIFLTGFMGTGKSTLGRQLADRLGWEFRELDELIEAAESASIERIFAEKGEPYFRAVERRMLSGLVAHAGHAVIACGGGALCTAANQALLEDDGITVWLGQPFEQIWQRRDQLAQQRPLMRGEPELRQLYERRLPYYRLASVHLSVAEDELDRALDELARILRERFAIG